MFYVIALHESSLRVQDASPPSAAVASTGVSERWAQTQSTSIQRASISQNPEFDDCFDRAGGNQTI